MAAEPREYRPTLGETTITSERTSSARGKIKDMIRRMMNRQVKNFHDNRPDLFPKKYN